MVRKYSESEADCLFETIKYGENPFLNAVDSCGGYFFEYEESHCATKYNEETDEVEYKDGFNNYFCIRIVK